MRGFPAALMQIGIQLLPACFGAVIFFSLLLLSRLAGSRSKIGQAPQEKAKIQQKRRGSQHEQQFSPCNEPLPEPLPELAEASGLTEQRSLPAGALEAATCWRVLVLILLLMCLPIFLHSGSMDSALGSTGTVVQSSVGSVTGEQDTIPVPTEMVSWSFDAAEPAMVSSTVNTTDFMVSPTVNTTDFLESVGEVKAGPADDGQAEDIPPLNVIKLTRQAKDPVDDDYVRSAYYGTVLIGTPPVEMTVVFDTGSGHLIVPSMFCHTPQCKVHKRYKRSSSYTARDINSAGDSIDASKPREAITVAFGTGEATGVLVEDVICFSSMTIPPNQTQSNVSPSCVKFHFMAATALSEEPFLKFSFDGVLGLGLPPLAQSPDFNFMKVFADSSTEKGTRRAESFGVFLANSGGEDSSIALGGWAKEHLAEDISWNSILDPELGHWILPIRNLWVDNYKFDFCSNGDCKAAMDTGTSLLSVPSDFFKEIYHMLLHFPPTSGHCKGHGPMLHFELEHATVSLGPREYAEVKKRKKPSLNPSKFYPDNCTDCAPSSRHDLLCQPMLMTLDLPLPMGPKLFILGEPVLRKYYSVYDADRLRIGISRAKHHPVELTHEDLLTATPGLGGRLGASAGRAARAGRQRRPTMFEIFRWQKAAQSRLPH